MKFYFFNSIVLYCSLYLSLVPILGSFSKGIILAILVCIGLFVLITIQTLTLKDGQIIYRKTIFSKPKLWKFETIERKELHIYLIGKKNRVTDIYHNEGFDFSTLEFCNGDDRLIIEENGEEIFSTIVTFFELKP